MSDEYKNLYIIIVLWVIPILRTKYMRTPQVVHKRLESIRISESNPLAGAIVLSPTDAACQEAVVGSVQRVVVARARTPRDTTVQHCL